MFRVAGLHPIFGDLACRNFRSPRRVRAWSGRHFAAWGRSGLSNRYGSSTRIRGNDVMVMMMVVVLCSVRSGIWTDRLRAGARLGLSAPDAKTRVRRQEAAASRASLNLRHREIAGRIFYSSLLRRGPCLRNRSSRHPLDRFHRCRHRFVAGFRPAEVGGKALEEILELGVLGRNLLFPARFGWFLLVRIQGRLIAAIVGEMLHQRSLNCTRASDSVGTPLQGAG